MGLEDFDEDFFTETLERMVVQENGSIDFHLKDGTARTYKTFKLRSSRHEATFTGSLTERSGAPPAATCTTGIAVAENMCTGGAAASQRSGRSAAGGTSRIPTSAGFSPT